jgi:O-antigen/teichoic acid export membrane protein
LSASAGEDRYGAFIGRIARGVGTGSFGQGVSRILGLVLQVALARMYGPAQLGIYVLGVTVSQLANVISQIGMDNGVVRYVAKYGAEGDTARVRGTIIQALMVTFGLSLAVSAAVFFGADLLARLVFDQPTLGPVFRVFAASVPFLTLMSMALWATQGFQTVKYDAYVRHIAQPLANLAFVAVSYVLGAEVLGAALSYLLSMLLGSVFALYYLVRVFPELLDRAAPAKFESRALFSVSGPMTVAGFSNYMNAWIVLTVLGVFYSESTVGIYNAALRATGLSTLVLLAFNGIFSPMISSLHGKAADDLHRLYGDVSRWTFTGGWAVFLVSLILAKDIMAVFGPEFVSGWPVIVAVCAARLFATSVGPTSRMLAMTGHQKIVMLATMGSAVFGIVVSLVFVPLYGIFGATAAFVGGTVFTNVVTLTGVRRRLGAWPYNREYLRPAGAGLVAAGATLALKLVLPLPDGLLTVLVLGPLFALLFAAALFALGLSPADRRFLGAYKLKRPAPRRGA